jgi:hypothetical protein
VTVCSADEFAASSCALPAPPQGCGKGAAGMNARRIVCRSFAPFLLDSGISEDYSPARLEPRHRH